MAGYRLIAEARRELRAGASFYELQDPGLGVNFLLEVRRLCHRIVEAPRLGAEVHPGVRRRMVRRFPYSILYVIENSGILVLAVAHQSRRPEYWTSRA